MTPRTRNPAPDGGWPPAAVALAVAIGLARLAAPAPLHAQEDAAGNGSQERPIEAALVYTGEVAANLRGGVQSGVVGLGNFDATLRLDAGPLAGWEGTTFFIYGLANHGGEPTDLTGDAQVASNIEAPDAVRLYEAWVQQNLAGPNLSFLAGLYDVNSEFDLVEEALVFLNSSFGIGATLGNAGVNGPSIFPVTSLGARIQWHPTHELYVQGALLDGVPGDPDDPGTTAVQLSAEDGALWVAEVGFLEHRMPEERPGPVQLGRDHVHPGIPWRVAAGVWQFTRRADRIGETGRVRARPGVYLLAEARPYREEDPGQGLGVFLRLGLADDRTNRFGSYTGAGVTYTGLLPGRDGDVTGLGIAAARNGDAYRRARHRQGDPATAAETTLELTYRAVVSSRLTLQPDLQLILNPGTDPERRHALLTSLRAVLGF